MKKINFSQVSVLIFLCMVSFNFMTLPALMYHSAGNSSWLVILIGTIIDAVMVIVLLYLLRDAKEKNIYEYLKKLIGKVGAKIVLVILLSGFLLQLMNITNEAFEYVSYDLYESLEWWYFALPLVAVIGVCASKGIRPIARSAQIMIWFIAGGVLFICIAALAKTDFTAYLPFEVYNVEAIFSALFRNGAWFGGGIFLFMMFGNVDFKNSKSSRIWMALIGAILITQLVLIVFYGIFQVTANQHFFALSDISQTASTTASLYRLQWLVVSVWAIEQVGFACVLMFCSAQCITQIFGLKKDKIPLLVIMFLLVVWLYLVFGNQELGQIFYALPVSIFFAVFNFVLPIFVLVMRLIRGKKVNETIHS